MEEPVRVEIAFQEREPVKGFIRQRNGSGLPAEGFDGWLDLLALLERAIAEVPDGERES